MTEHIQVNGYKLKLENYNGFFKGWLKKNFITKTKLAMTFIYAAFLAAIPWAKGGWMHFDAAGITTSLLFSIFLIFVLLPLVTYVLTIAQYLRGGATKKEHSIEISDDGVIKSSDTSRIELKWAGIYDVTETRKTILIFTNRKCALIVPKNAFTTAQEATAFLTNAKNYWAQNKA